MSHKKRKAPSADTSSTFFAPLAHLPYPEQLAVKSKLPTTLIKDVRKGLKERSDARRYPVPEFNPTILPIAHLPESPTMAHRNKCEFTFAPDGAGGLGVGFVRRVDGSSFVVERITNDNPLVTPSMRVVLWSLESALLPRFTVYDRTTTRTGLLRTVLLREGAVEIGVVVQVSAQGPIEEIKQALSDWYENIGSTHAPIVSSVSIQINPGLSDACSVAPELVAGDSPCVKISVCGLDFDVHPLSFFQTNTKACEMLYGLVCDAALEGRNGEEDLLFIDVCCGVGTIGQCCAAIAPMRILGVDISESAISNARENAIRNAVNSSTRYEAGRCEDVLPKVLKDELHSSKSCVAIVDPPRAGLHKTVLRALRDNSEIKSVIYVSCNPESLASDCLLLCEILCERPDEDDGVSRPFRCEWTRPVDMFPHTAHCEMIAKFVRE